MKKVIEAGKRKKSFEVADDHFDVFSQADHDSKNNNEE